MQDRIDWTCYTNRIRRNSLLATFFLHSFFIFLIFSNEVKKEKLEKEIFIVKLINVPEVKSVEKIEDVNVQEKESLSLPVKKEINKISKVEKIKNKLDETKSELKEFSLDEYRQRLYSKLKKEENIEISTRIKQENKISEIKITNEDIHSSIPFSISEIPEWYVNLLKRKIEENWIVEKYLTGLSAIVSFRIYENGKVENITIEKSSGYKKFDNSIIEAIKSVKNWPEFPKNIKDRYLDVVIIFKTEG
ncbi:MAG: TonB family protein [Candidatus Omnitrophica bacterium]|nr:TonB family protein [Candidatus Omnitrophota bacterium]MCM8806836.1 TonB family protein [Candidatus Omnitrophota bacterium]